MPSNQAGPAAADCNSATSSRRTILPVAVVGVGAMLLTAPAAHANVYDSCTANGGKHDGQLINGHSYERCCWDTLGLRPILITPCKIYIDGVEQRTNAQDPGGQAATNPTTPPGAFQPGSPPVNNPGGNNPPGGAPGPFQPVKPPSNNRGTGGNNPPGGLQ
jgi:hypothetical protein